MDNVQCFVLILVSINPCLKRMCMYNVYITGESYKLTMTGYLNKYIEKKVNRSNICSIDKPLSVLLIFGFVY